MSQWLQGEAHDLLTRACVEEVYSQGNTSGKYPPPRWGFNTGSDDSS